MASQTSLPRGEQDSVVPPATPDIAALVALIQDLRSEVSELKAQKPAAPTFKPMERPDLHNTAERRRQMMDTLQRAGQRAEGNLDQTAVDYQGHPIGKAMLREMGPAFQVGDVIRVRREVTREGGSVSWGDILDKVHSEGVGVVQRTLYLTKAHVWKYLVRVNGLTPTKGDGFYEHELDAA